MVTAGGSIIASLLMTNPSYPFYSEWSKRKLELLKDIENILVEIVNMDEDFGVLHADIHRCLDLVTNLIDEMETQ